MTHPPPVVYVPTLCNTCPATWPHYIFHPFEPVTNETKSLNRNLIFLNMMFLSHLIPEPIPTYKSFFEQFYLLHWSYAVDTTQGRWCTPPKWCNYMSQRCRRQQLWLIDLFAKHFWVLCVSAWSRSSHFCRHIITPNNIITDITQFSC